MSIISLYVTIFIHRNGSPSGMLPLVTPLGNSTGQGGRRDYYIFLFLLIPVLAKATPRQALKIKSPHSFGILYFIRC